ncbi:Protein CBG26782 [Caenorhabditis briggsae]|uniref:Protein CBG26782 n=1 Tax=Caenorhabditis briggsae TaxID=6238 RepID=B6IH94_CAEBR|nr:Protein CBG26782 [Caenorhabditis briggsae]CAR99274.1 Protein CBG26782 [Caenorhabditis briggsae]
MSSDNITLFFDNVTLFDGNFTIPEVNATIIESTVIPYLFKWAHSDMARWSFFIAFCTWIPTGLLIFRSIYKVYKSNKIIKNSISTQLCVTVMNIVLSIFSHLSQEIFGDLISILPFTHNIGNLFIAVIFWATHPIFGRNGLISTYRMETRNQ